MDSNENSPESRQLSGKHSVKGPLKWLPLMAIPVLAVAGVMASGVMKGDADVDNSPAKQPAPVKHPVLVSKPAGPPTIDTGQVDPAGQPIVANCTTCHTTKPPNPRLVSGSDLKDFHQGLTTNHGDRSCLSCHNPDDYNTLRLADGKPVTFTEVMTLCSQCHGPQYKDYLNGAHGGMTGYWDLTQGPRQRNNCIDCHDPHAPQYPKLMPVHRPNDRFLRPTSSENAHE